jgi:hypothetical protein
LHVLNHAITFSVFPSLSKVAIIHPVLFLLTSAALVLYLFYLRRLMHSP